MSRMALKQAVTIICVASLSSCALLTDLAKSAFQKPTVRLKQAQPKDLSLSGMTLDTVWVVDNPNPVGLTLARSDYALFIDDKQVVAGQPPNGISLPAQGRGQLVFPAQVKFADLVPVVQTFLTKDRATYRVEGTVGINTPLGVLSFPLQAQGDFEVPKVPQVQLQNPKVASLSLTGATIEFPMVVTNRNSFALPVSGLSGSLYIGSSAVGTVSTGDLGQLGGNATKQVSLPLTVNFLQGASAALSAIQSGRANVRFVAQMQSGGIASPIDVTQALQFIK